MVTLSIEHRNRTRRWPGHFIGTLLLLALSAAPAAARQIGAVEGTIRAAGSGEPLAGVAITVTGGGRTAVTDARGRYHLASLPAGEHTLVAERIGYDNARRTVVVPAGGVAQVDLDLTPRALALPDIVVSVDREARRRAETPATVNVVAGDVVRTTRAAHPSELLGRVPGVWVNVTGGEGHMAAIRQPQSTNPVYLYLEDGVPTRSTGFFNHNALYEVNLPQADRVEVIKGPATALYGSDAIGATIDVGTRAPSSARSLEASLEGGAYGWGRLLLDASGTAGKNGLRAELNLTRTDGWRDGTAYDRQAATLRWDRALGAATTLKTVASYSRIDQQTAGTSAISRDDFRDHPTANYTPISFRKVEALRLSTELRHVRAQSLLTLTAFARDNDMELLPNWALAYDPTVYSTGHRSLGLMARYRRDFAPLRTRLVGGVDVDHSPGYRLEHAVRPTRVGKVYADYTEGDAIYDYDVTFQDVSPYLQAEFSPVERLRLSAGVRYDHLGYDYRSRLSPLATGPHRRPADARVSYDHLSPKLGATYEVAPSLNLFAAYGHGFRAPSEGQLFRQGRAENTLALHPVKVDSYEGGIRGQLGARVRYEVSAYRMVKEDDILSYTHPDGTQESTNAGRTLHRGVEVGLTVALVEELKLDLGYSHARHGYELWQPRAGVDFGGKEMEQAPRDIANALLAYTPGLLRGGKVALETSRIGGYWMDADNTTRYEGHTLLTLRGDLPVHRRITLFGRLANLTNARYAELATYTVARGEELAPGMPRTFNFGIQYR